MKNLVRAISFGAGRHRNQRRCLNQAEFKSAAPLDETQGLPGRSATFESFDS
jgi:hypothetical protein